MVRVYWKSSRVIAFTVGLILLYIIARLNSYDYESSVVLPKVHPKEVWEFVADFSNMKKLNPTLIDFNIIGESGNYDHWKYSVEYRENLSHWPYLGHIATAHFNITADAKKQHYFIHSTHKTCLFNGSFCMDSLSVFKFSQSSGGSLCEEKIVYQCPMILSKFCHREVLFQRKAIMFNLQRIFSK